MTMTTARKRQSDITSKPMLNSTTVSIYHSRGFEKPRLQNRSKPRVSAIRKGLVGR